MSDTKENAYIKQWNQWRDKSSCNNMPTYKDLPDIELYMDQVIALMEKYWYTNEKWDDKKFVTPSMINNYVKLGIIEPPVKKKYSKDHIAKLIIICTLKRTLSISVIKNIISKLLDKMSIAELYDTFIKDYSELLDSNLKIIDSHFLSEHELRADCELEFASYALKMAALSEVGRFLSEGIIDVYNAGDTEKASEKESK